jgi:hypothetical protein
MAGIPDGLGALPGRLVDGEIVRTPAYDRVHEPRIPSGSGISRAQSPGAFVSQWTIALDTLRVQNGPGSRSRGCNTWDAASARFLAATATPSAQLYRFCSADLPARTAFYNPATGNGFDGRLYLNGEETTGGRAFAHVLTGPFHGLAAELAYLGRFAWENAVPHPNLGDKTVVPMTDAGRCSSISATNAAAETDRTRRPHRRRAAKVVDGGASYSRGPVAREITARSAADSCWRTSATSPSARAPPSGCERGARRTGFARPEDGA